MQYTYESCILYYTLLQRSMLHMMTWLISPHKVSVTPVVVGNIVFDETAFCSHCTVAWTEDTSVAWIQIFNSRHHLRNKYEHIIILGKSYAHTVEELSLAYWYRRIILRYCSELIYGIVKKWMNHYGELVKWYWQKKLRYFNQKCVPAPLFHHKAHVD